MQNYQAYKKEALKCLNTFSAKALAPEQLGDGFEFLQFMKETPIPKPPETKTDQQAFEISNILRNIFDYCSQIEQYFFNNESMTHDPNFEVILNESYQPEFIQQKTKE